MVGKADFLAQAHQPVLSFVIEIGEAIFGLGRIAPVEGDNLLGAQLPVPAQRFENPEKVVVGEGVSLAARHRMCAGAVFSDGLDLHRDVLGRGRWVAKRQR